jgi:hypothetical protein
MNEILDDLFFQCQQLSDDELESLFNGLITERQNRQDREKRAAWVKVCEAITHYTANFGNIRVADFCGGEDTEICLYHGCFTFSEYGDIEVGA